MDHLLNSGAAPDGRFIVEATSENFVEEVLTASTERPVIVDFWADWCGPCKQLTPILEKLVREQSGAVKLVKVDVDRNQEIAAQLRVQSLPTIIAFKGGQPVDAFMGALPESEVRKFIGKLTGDSGPSPVDALVAAGKDALASGDALRAAEIFAHILQAEADNGDALGGLAKAYLALDRLDDAQATMKAVPAAQAGHPEVAAARAAIEMREEAASAGDPTDLAKAVEANPDDHESRFALAIALQGRGDMESAGEALLEIIRRDREWNEEAARKQLVKMFEAAGPADPFTLKMRRKLSSILFA